MITVEIPWIAVGLYGLSFVSCCIASWYFGRAQGLKDAAKIWRDDD